MPRSAAHHAEGRDYPSDLEQAVKKSAAAIPKRGTVLLCTGHHAHLSHAHPGVNVAATEGPLVIATPLADSSLAHPRCAGPCQSRCRGTLPLSRCRHPSQAAFAPSAPGMVTCCAPTVADQAAAARARCSAAPLPTMAIPFLTTSPPSPISPLRGQPIGQHAGDGRRLRSRSGKARGWWREIGQRARPPTEAALPRSLQPGTGLLTH